MFLLEINSGSIPSQISNLGTFWVQNMICITTIDLYVFVHFKQRKLQNQSYFT